VTLNAGGGTFNTNGNDATLGGTITGAGGLTKSGGGTLTLMGTNDYQGNTTISGGTLGVSTDANLGAATGILSVRGGGTLQFIADNFTSNRNVTIGPGNAIFDTNGHDATLGGAITGGSGSTEFHKIGAGALTLGGNNTYTGQLQIIAGTLILTGDNQPSITSTPISSGATLQIGNGGATGSLTGNVTNGGLFIINRSNAYTFDGVISGTGSFVQMGAGTTTLTATNTYTGTTTIAAGTLSANASAALGDGSATNTLIFTGGTLQAGGTITSPSTRGVTLTSTGIIDTNGNSVSIAGVISGSGDLTKTGTGTLTLSGANTYSGATTITAGTLAAQNATALGTTTAGTTVIAGATLEIADGVAIGAEPLNLSGAGVGSNGALVVTSGAASFGGAITLGASASIGGNGNLTLGGTVNDSSAGTSTLTQVGSGTLTFSNPVGATNALAAVTTSAGQTTAINGGSVRTTGDQAYGGSVTTSGATTLTSTGGDITVSNAVNWSNSSLMLVAGRNIAINGNMSGGAAGDLTALANGNLTIGATGSISGKTIALSATGAFTNNRGSDAVSASDRWLVYSSAPNAQGENFGNLNSNNTAIWGNTFVTLPPASVTLPGNRYIFATPATLTVTSLNESKTYGSTANLSLYTVTGFQAGVPNAFLGDPTTVSGTPGFFSVGTPATANVGNYAIIVSQGTLSATNGYTFAFNSTGLLTVNPQALTITANSATQTYSNVPFSGGNGVTYTGFVNGENSSVLSGTIAYGGNAPGAVNVGAYTIIPSGQSSSNYAINYVNATLTINPQPLTITANNVTQTFDNVPYSGGNGVTYNGFVNGQNSSLLGGSIAFGGNAQGAINVGTYAIIPSGQTSSNYAITYVNGTLTITPPPIAVVLDALGTAANAAGTTAPSTVMNATVLPAPTSLPGTVNFGSNTILPYGSQQTSNTSAGSTNQQTSNTSGGNTNQQTSNTRDVNENQQTSNRANTSQQTSKKRNGGTNQQTNKRNGSTSQQTSNISDRRTN
jgi:autotransporter-associated beta strand protein